MIERPPCIKDKCLLYPSCKNKDVISCSILYKYFKDTSYNIKQSTLDYSLQCELRHRMIIYIHHALPNINHIWSDKFESYYPLNIATDYTTKPLIPFFV